ncbi:MAG: site-specific integrase [Mycobacteriaceae bacterium]|nr:site-specific integrase [Mycobacteriaceae bacterium]
MSDDAVSVLGPDQRSVEWYASGTVPAIIDRAGGQARKRFLEFFTATIRNENTRMAYARAVGTFFEWCREYRLELLDIEPIHVAAYVERHPGSPPTVKQHLAAIRMLFDWLVTGQVLAMNPAASVRGPKQARQLLDAIDTAKLSGLRDRALIAVMVFSFARVSAAVSLKAEGYYQDGKRWWFRFREKGGKQHQVPAHHTAEAYLDAYLFAAGIGEDKKAPLFRTVTRHGRLSDRQMSRNDAFRMVKRRAAAAGLPLTTCNHTFRATGITAYLENGGTIENAQAIAAHESPRTTKLYDRTSDEITLDEIERIRI